VKYTYNWRSAPEDVLITTSGCASVKDLEAMIRTGLDDPRFRPGLSVLLDHRATDHAGLSGADVARHAETVVRNGRVLGAARIAIVVARPVDYGIQRMVDAMIDGRISFSERVFRTLEEARSWLTAHAAQPVPRSTD